jgi:hypothetical protein
MAAVTLQRSGRFLDMVGSRCCDKGKGRGGGFIYWAVALDIGQIGFGSRLGAFL